MSEGSVTIWIRGLRTGDPEAFRKIWDRYYDHVARLAHSMLRGVLPGLGDEDDVAAAAFLSFFHVAADARGERLTNRSNLRQILITLTRRKAIDLRRRGAAARRGGCMAVSGAPVGELPDSAAPASLALELAEWITSLVKRLPDDELALRRIAAMKLEGQTNDQVAAACGCSARTVERRLGLIRLMWEGHL